MSTIALSPGTEVRSSQRTYTIRSVLGQGGFGITYLVETELQMGNIPCTANFALKEHFIQMLCERESSSNRVRFMQSASKEVESSKRAFVSEAQRLQRLGIQHRNVVSVDEVFEANGTAYYVMEYLTGGSLANYVKSHGGRLTWADTAMVMQPICDAVAMLHRNRVAHYDIKPQNIMVTTNKQGLRPVLIDFGLAKHYDGQGQATSSIAAGGYTPGYAPVEQYTGIQEFSPTADVYALAATICYCLTGHAPAKADKLTIPKAKQPTISFNSPLTASSFSCIMFLDIFLSHFECLLATFILPGFLEYVYSFLRNLLYLISSAANNALCDRKNGRTSLVRPLPCSVEFTLNRRSFSEPPQRP